MAKKANVYRLKLETVSTLKEDVKHQNIEFEFGNHDEIFGIIDAVKSKELFETEAEATEFALGLKLFSEVMLKNKKHPLFEEFQPEFVKFMKKLKAS
ncbi:DUF3861 domain-containing protein [Zunongwangia sp. SCSIO 43204]|uniref:DUF3861 domain-containing protein n=2 Tax=Zunongwangia TaxID=417127 RepID=A0A1Y1T4L4_9FLAO|nr:MULTISPECIES: DUF3861 domain-containing protein [Zunongwangia]ORL45989.1 hypothetical protein IIF7_07711 [Zunongwangia atlantica 22II14-10F7]UAB85465.1 DUF3861 domain-containing protein [Zunongwangia sp. SCSIO 43204]SFB80808.1 protein of unknown function [Zunongwangia mangrovi]